MRIALVDTTRRRQHYSVALLKLGAWRRSLGDECALFEGPLPDVGDFDEIWLSTIFSFDMPRALTFATEARRRADRVLVGGVSATLFPQYFEREGFEVVRGLVPEAEAMAPDYDLLGARPKYAVTHTSRGCPRNCDFCMVSELEPKFFVRTDWQRDVPDDAEEILFYDNNVLAMPPAKLERVVGEVRDVVAARGIRAVDFNQGLDARLLTDKSADLLATLPLPFLRFAFDGMQEDGPYQRAVRMMADRGAREFRTYVLYNHTGTPEDFYHRLRVSAELQEDLRAAGHRTRVLSFPMRYHPVVSADVERDYTGYHWTPRVRDAVQMILKNHAAGAMFSCPESIEDFEHWWGADAAAFVRLCEFPKLSLLLRRRKGSLRLERYAARTADDAGKV